MSLTPAEIKPKSFESRRNSFFFFTRGGCVSCLRVCLGARLLLQSYQYPNLSEGADRVAGQLRGDKECSFSGVTKIWQSLEEGAGKRSCSECGSTHHRCLRSQFSPENLGGDGPALNQLIERMKRELVERTRPFNALAVIPFRRSNVPSSSWLLQ